MMIGLDTNVVVRFLTNDDVKQANAVKARLRSVGDSGDKAYFSKISMLETVWVLSSVYEFEDEIILDGLDHFAQLPMIALEDPDLLARLKGLYSKKGPGLADQLILADYVFNGCSTVITFDKRAKMLAGFSAV